MFAPKFPKIESEKPVYSGFFLILGSFLPEIEIWDIDMVDAVEPNSVLGGKID